MPIFSKWRKVSVWAWGQDASLYMWEFITNVLRLSIGIRIGI